MTAHSTSKLSRALHMVFGTLLIGVFFLTWVSWDGNKINGADFPGGRFFEVSSARFGLSNPFPKFGWVNYIFWFAPAAALIALAQAVFGRKRWFFSFLAGVLTLSLAAVFFLFTRTLGMLGAVPDVWTALQPAWWVAVIVAIGIIITSGAFPILVRLLIVIIGPLATWIGFTMISNYIENKTYEKTDDIKPAYTVSAQELLKEFGTSDSIANKKYLNQIVLVNGRISEIETPADSTVNIKFADENGSYIIFPFDKISFSRVKDLKEGDSIGVKGACSGDVYSEILETRIINFERCVLNQP
ncbi:hypothetical protein JMG10_06725 [Nostoc ellipsosporum NOK]|nr:hypothetical protein [Nostoc ellipsosporum NOK]